MHKFVSSNQLHHTGLRIEGQAYMQYAPITIQYCEVAYDFRQSKQIVMSDGVRIIAKTQGAGTHQKAIIMNFGCGEIFKAN